MSDTIPTTIQQADDEYFDNWHPKITPAENARITRQHADRLTTIANSDSPEAAEAKALAELVAANADYFEQLLRGGA